MFDLHEIGTGVFSLEMVYKFMFSSRVHNEAIYLSEVLVTLNILVYLHFSKMVNVCLIH